MKFILQIVIESGKHWSWVEGLLAAFLNILMRLGLQFWTVAMQVIVFIETMIQIAISTLFRNVVILTVPSVTVWKEKQLLYARTQVIRNSFLVARSNKQEEY